MVLSNHLNPGMTISVGNKLYRVESSVKVTVPKGTPFIKAKLRDLAANEVVEKSFKLNQSIDEVALTERHVEFLYPEGKDYLFLDIDSLEQVLIPDPGTPGDPAPTVTEGIKVVALLKAKPGLDGAAAIEDRWVRGHLIPKTMELKRLRGLRACIAPTERVGVQAFDAVELSVDDCFDATTVNRQAGVHLSQIGQRRILCGVHE